ncbi:hypothetical protein IJH72_00435 [Candidatus Saccharibacteria bacterium]|nr:hypothetical protein [Candidatus Saccharibacteria bacterium]
MPKRKRSKKWVSWLIIFALLIVSCVIAYLVWDNYFNDKKNGGRDELETSEVTEEKKEEVEYINGKEAIEENEEEDDKKVKQYEGEDPNKAEELSGVITYAGLVDSTVMIRVNIDQYLGGGTCTLNLINDGSVVYEDTANISSSASTSTCEGFNVPAGGLSGGYDIVIKIESGGKHGTIKGEVGV